MNNLEAQYEQIGNSVVSHLLGQVNLAGKNLKRFNILSSEILTKTETIKTLMKELKDTFTSNSSSFVRGGILTSQPGEYERNYFVNVESVINLLDSDR